MRKVFSTVMFLLAISVLGFSANVPKVNNHGFPQNLKTTQKIYEVENPILQEDNAIVKETVTKPSTTISKKKTAIKKQVENKPLTISPANENMKPLKKEIKQENKKNTKTNENGGVASLLSYIFASIALCLGALVNPFLGFPIAIAGLILGIVGVSKGKSNRLRGILGIIGNALVILVCILILILAVAVVATV